MYRLVRTSSVLHNDKIEALAVAAAVYFWKKFLESINYKRRENPSFPHLSKQITRNEFEHVKTCHGKNDEHDKNESRQDVYFSERTDGHVFNIKSFYPFLEPLTVAQLRAFISQLKSRVTPSVNILFCLV